MINVQRTTLAQTQKMNLPCPLPLLDRGNRPHQEPDEYTEVRNVRFARDTTDSLVPSLLLLVGLLLVVVAMSNPDVAVMTVVSVVASVSMFPPQLMPSWTRWYAGQR